MAEPRALTAKQSAYRDARVSGLGPSDAYRTAYSASRMSDKAISVEAAKLEKHPSIALAISSVRSRAAQAAVVNAQAILERAWAIGKSDAKDRVPALALAAKAFPEFRDSPLVDQSQHIHLPPGTTLADIDARIRELRGGLAQ